MLALVAVACGGGSDDPVSAGPTAPDASVGDPATLPTNLNAGSDGPAIANACLEGEPDCNDTLSPGDVPRDLPPSSDDEPGSITPIAVGGALVGNGLTVADALATTAKGTLAVQGFVVDDGTGARLCDLLAESYPAQCGGDSMPVTGYEEVVGIPLSSTQGLAGPMLR